jgi:hypothetical protein
VSQIYIKESTFSTELLNSSTNNSSYGNEILFTNSGISKVDGTISFNQRKILTGHDYEISTEAPYIVVLLPNLSKEINRNGMLTTSLYYRFDADFIPYLFSGDDIKTVNALYPSDSLFNRAYAYNSEKGRQLSAGIKRNYGEISIGYESITLGKAANFFNDILSRDKFNIKIVTLRSDADFMISFIPCSKTDPNSSMTAIIDLLESTSPKFQSQQETLDINRNYLELASKANSEAYKIYYWNLIDYSLKYDFGVFPLFQPTIFFHHNNNLTNCRFDENGQLDYKSIVKLILPPTISGVIR